MANTQRRLNVVLAVDSGGMNDGIKAGLAKVREFADETKRINSDIAAQQRAVVAAAAAARRAMDTPEAAARTGEAIRAVQRLNELNDKRSVASGLADMEAKGVAEERATSAAFQGELARLREADAVKAVGRETRQLTEDTRRGTSEIEKQAQGALRLGKAVFTAHLAAGAIRLTTSIIRGDWEVMSDTIRRLPAGVGQIADATVGFLEEVTGARKEFETFQQRVKEGAEWSAGMTSLATIREDALFRASVAKMAPDDARRAEAERDLKKNVDAIWATPGTKKSKEFAEAALRGQYAAEVGRTFREKEARKAGPDPDDARREKVSEMMVGFSREAKTLGLDEKGLRLFDLKELVASNEILEEAARRLDEIAAAKKKIDDAETAVKQAVANAAQEERAAKEGWDAKLQGDEEVAQQQKRADERKFQDRAKLSEWAGGRLDAASPMRQYKAFEAKIQSALNAGEMTYAQGNAQLAGEITRLTGGAKPQGGQFMDAEGYSRAIQSALMQKPDVSEQILAELEKLNRLGVHLAA